jgi:hypothetical protein
MSILLQIYVTERGGWMFGSLYSGGPRFESVPESDYPSERLSVRLDKRRDIALN